MAYLAATFFCVLTFLFSGYLVKIKTVIKGLQWIQYFSIFRYSINILSINEFQGLTFTYANTTHIPPKNGEDLLTDFGIDHKTSWDLWKNFVALGSMTLGFFTLSYLQLRFMKKTK